MNFPRLHLPLRFIGFAIIIGALSLAPQSALAQRGGGGGGHAGGGGGHFGGGSSHFGGGSSHSSASSNSSAHTNTHASNPPAAGPGTNSRNAAGSAAASGRAGVGTSGASNSSTATSEAVVGNGVASSRANTLFSAPQHTEIGFAPSNAITFSRTSPNEPLSFTGEGHQIWQTGTRSSDATTFSAHPQLNGTSRPADGMVRPQPPHIVHPPLGFNPYLYPGYGFYGFNPYYGLGYGFGCDPFWGFGCGGFGYGWGPSYGFGYGSGYGYYGPGWDTGSNAPQDFTNDSSEPPSPNTWQDNSDSSGNEPESGSQVEAGEVGAPTTLIYLSDGTTYAATDYWVADNKLHYVTNYGGEGTLDLSQVDMQRTVDANAKNGVTFTLHPAPTPQLNPPPANDSASPQQ